MTSPFIKYLLIVAVLLLATPNQFAQADDVEAKAVSVNEWEIDTPSLRQRRGQNERRLFYWGNLLCKYTILQKIICLI